jgi:TolB-like protein
VSLDEDPSVYSERVEQLRDRIANHPEDGTALRDLGAIYMRTGRPRQAYSTLKKARAERPDDPQILFFLGLASERIGKQDAALDLFRQFDTVPTSSRYHALLKGRYEWLVRKRARQQMSRLAAQEREQEQLRNEVSPRTVAVLPLSYQGSDDQYAALGRGLAEMITADLANVERLQVVERIRLQALLDELELARSEFVDAETAPRVGHLLGAGQLVGGTYLVPDDERLRLQVSLADVASGDRQAQVGQRQGALDQLFEIQKEVTYTVIEQLGVELTPQERTAIEAVPTSDLQAFLAFSRGLVEEDRGNYAAAAQHYRQAQQADPNFEAARQQEQTAQNLNAGGGSQSKALSQAPSEDVPQPQSTVDPMQQRLRSLGVGPTRAAGADGEGSRDPAQETQAAEESTLDDPPDPPSAPGGGNQGGE